MKANKRPRVSAELPAATDGTRRGVAGSTTAAQTVHSSAEAGTWSEAEASRFFHAHKEHGPNWKQVAKAVGNGKNAHTCEALYRKHTAFLSLPTKFQFEVTFLAMMRDQRASDSQAQTLDHGSDAASSEGYRQSRGTDSRLEGDLPAQGNGRAGKGRGTPRATKVGRPDTPDGSTRGPVKSARLAERNSDPLQPDDDPADGVLRGKRKRKPAFTNDSDYVMDPITAGRQWAGASKAETLETTPGREMPEGRGARGAKRKSEFEADERGADALLALAELAHAGEDVQGALQADHLEQQLLAADARARARDDSATEEETHDAEVSADEVGDEGEGPRAKRSRRRPVPRHASSSPSMHEQSTGSPSPRRTTPSRKTTSARKRSLAAQKAARVRAQNAAAAAAAAAADTDNDQGEGALHAGGNEGSVEEGGMWLRSREQLEDGEEPDLEAREEVDFDNSDDDPSHPWAPMPRGRRRKPLPEKIPPMMSPIKSLFGRRTTAGLMLGIPGHASGSLLSSLLLGPPSALSDAGSNMRPSELRLRRCLDARTRRWCMYEFFCSALDRPWLLACELREWLAHAGLPPDLRLTRAEWVAVRAALGRPRRLSLAFLHEERAKLEAWREEMRAKYEEVGCGNEVPPDVPRPLQVGQRVTARHPVTRQLHDGDILTTGHSLYRVQFDRRELGVELIKDVDVMPIDPTENLPASMLASAAAQGLQVNGRQVTLGVPIRRPRPQLPPAPPPVTRSPSELKADSVMASGEVDRKALIRHVEAALDRKEILIARLKAMNDVAETGRHIDSVTRKLLPSFEREYAQAILDLRNLNRDLERGLVVLEAGTPLVTRVASSLQRRTNIPSIDHALAAHEPTQAPSMKLAPMAGHVSRLTPEAAWAAAWIEAQSLVTSLQAAINRGDVTLGSRLQSSSGLAGAGGMQRPPPTAGNMRPAGAGAPPPPAAGLRPPSAGAPPAAQPQSGPAAAATGMPPMQSTAAPQPPYPQQHPHAAGSTGWRITLFGQIYG
ncbi:hypothetical protein WJX73_007410 [Symbiochloris irregularis]|uniref:SANT domain-containing protein n=1 Tax=Symbiochloris irregularis TaxID=706552 RepID=A0AAW1NL77_9CHLO